MQDLNIDSPFAVVPAPTNTDTLMSPSVSPVDTKKDDKPVLILLSPNGGEVEYSDSATVKWAQTGLNPADLLTITFRDSDWNSCWVGKVSVSLGQVDFTPRDVKCTTGSTFTSFRYNEKYIVQIRDDAASVSDQSDAAFTIVR